jgi:hypothetical protein
MPLTPVPALEPASPSVPAATENKQYQYEDDEERHRIHYCLLWSENPFLSA